MTDIICFHNPDEENGYMSNWYISSFTVNGITFSSMEQYMMYYKSITFGDELMARKILSTDDVAKIKTFGRMVANYEDNYWNGIRQIIVYKGLLAKFFQNEDIKSCLNLRKEHYWLNVQLKIVFGGLGYRLKILIDLI